MTSPGTSASRTIDWNAQFSRLISPEGRVNRATYAYVWLASVVVSLVVSAISPILAIIVSLVIIWPSLATGVKRLHDQGLTGWIMAVNVIPWITFFFSPSLGLLTLLLSLVSLAALAIFLICLFRPGTAGENPYGSQPGPGFAL
jgi:uncharacterized membrane protein YhaH (DUF805 family)